MDLNEIWKLVLGELEVDLGKQNLGLYFKNSQLLSLENSIAKIGFLNRGVADQANARYYALIQTSLQKISHQSPLSLIFEVNDQPVTSNQPLATEEAGPLFETPKEDQEAIKEAVKATGLHPDFILEEFCVSTSNQLAFAAAQAVIKDPGKNYNPFFIWGGVGVGKTHLMQAIGHEILRRNPRARVVYASGEQFTNEIIRGIRKQNTQDFKDKYRSADALLIDDIQFFSGKDTAQEEFFHTFNTLHQRQGQIIMTSDRKPADIKDLADRLKSRFEGGLVADISTPDSELKTAICQLKAKKRGIELSTTVASLIANNTDNIRTLDGAIQIIISKAASEHQEITPDFVAETLKLPIISPPVGGHLEPRTILDEICAHYEIPMKVIKGVKRDKPIAIPRQILMYLLKKHTHYTLDEIGSFIGGRDHTTVLHGIKKIESLLQNNSKIQSDISQLQQRLNISPS
ncbi:MAG: Chromosomal replication initiator protein DnaA [Microgenomates group bacterium GW2011_GWA1_48_10]|uniref:Chromosomal replication initiator protein DnaA n=1 Tax=Candidatus Gottesmanbacteria bacterium RIFCSPHIGHO2_01_FULL_47_48 TaxID=1798381 RepID=A0A1F6A5B9_9BACT|nr:MAG: Chromosomal replication initiator protein DnaA [Microgenomates group bacterium GW2011_GWA1_48_10]OGG19652.1 MAG: chromosomal replication initiator protein DnaA [Candidatus Gottesmanbacteria bacterium RIFCSPHIGHO2_01_FULL_47_48]